MANTLFHNTVKDAAILHAFRNKLGPLMLFSHRAAPEGSVKGSVIKVTTAPVIAGAAFNGSYVGGDRVMTAVDVTLNQHTIAAAHVQDAEAAKGSEGVLSALEASAIHGLGQSMFEYLCGLVLATNYGDTATDKLTVAAASLDSDDLADVALLLDNKKAPEGILANGQSARAAFLTRAAINSLRKDDAVKDASKSLSDEALRLGVVSRVAGIDIFPISALPSAVAAQNTYGFVTTMDAIAWASVNVVPQGQLAGSFSTVREDETGALFGLRNFYEQESGKLNICAEALYGASVNNDAGLVRLVSA
jgi:hypothetical protein